MRETIEEEKHGRHSGQTPTADTYTSCSTILTYLNYSCVPIIDDSHCSFSVAEFGVYSPPFSDFLILTSDPLMSPLLDLASCVWAVGRPRGTVTQTSQT